MRKRIALTVAVAAVWGACATWIFWWLFAPMSGPLLFVAQPVVSGALRNGWSAEQITPYLLGATRALTALLYGLLFGFPLGLLGTGFLAISWLTFVAAFLITLLARMLFAQVGIGAAVESVTHPIYWLTAIATLLFIALGNRLRFAYVQRRAA